jgi:hypothetical protein
MPSPQAPAHNHLLAALPGAERERIDFHLKLVWIPLGKVLSESGDVLRHVYWLYPGFPITFRAESRWFSNGEWGGHPRSPQPVPADGAALKAQRAKRPGERGDRLWTRGDDGKHMVTSPITVHIPYSSCSR